MKLWIKGIASLLVFIFFLFTHYATAVAMTIPTLPATITSPIRVTMSDSPDPVDGIIEIGFGGTLQIDPGVTLYFKRNIGNKIVVKTGGTLIIGGSGSLTRVIPENYNPPQAYEWYGIENHGGTITIQNSLIAESQYSVIQDGSASKLILSNSTINHCNVGIQAISGTVNITNSTFTSNSTAIRLENVDTSFVCGNQFGPPAATPSISSFNTHSLILSGACYVDIRNNNFVDGDNTSIQFMRDTALPDNSNVKISFNNFYHHRTLFDPLNDLSTFYTIDNIGSVITVYNSYWENNGIAFTTASAVKSPDSGLVTPDDTSKTPVVKYVLVNSPQSAPVNFVKDISPPQLVELSPTESQPTAGIHLAVVITDEGWGVDPNTIEITLTGTNNQKHIFKANSTPGVSYTYNNRQYIFSVDIPVDLVDKVSLPEDIYSWTIVAKDLALNSLLVPAALANQKLTVSTTAGSSPSIPGSWNQWTSGGYHLITVPVSSYQKDHKTTLGLNASDTLIARWQNGAYIYYGNSALESFEPGKAFWVKLGTDDTFTNSTISGQTQTTDLSISISQPGWYMIGNPFADKDLNFNQLSFTYNKTGSPTEYSLLQAVMDGYASFGVWGYNSLGYYFERNSMKIWEGYWINLKQPCTLNFHTTSFQPSNISILNWDVQLTASQAQNSDSSNYFGLARTAVAGVDVFDAEKPPAINPSLKSFFVPQNSNQEYGVDFHSASSANEKWHYTVTGLSAGEARLTWSNLTAVPQNYQLVLKDLASNKETDLRLNNSYAFTVAAETKREFEIIMTDLSLQRVQISNLKINRNPFAPMRESVVVSYDLSALATIEVRVYDWVGNLVYIFPTTAGSISSNSFSWTGRNNLGKMVANGIYFAKITARNGSSQTSQIVKLAVVN